MRFAVLADIHSNLPALEAVLEDARAAGAQGYFIAGDLVSGPQPLEVLQVLRSLPNTHIILGNNDRYVLDMAAGSAPPAWYSSLQWGFVRHGTRLLDRPALDYLASLPEQRSLTLPEGTRLRMVHGSPDSLSELVYPDRDAQRLEQILASIPESIYLCGHLHIAWKLERPGRLALNPGALFAANGKPGAHYALLTREKEGWRAELRVVAYDVQRLEAAFRSSGLLEAGGALARCVLLNCQTGVNHGLRFMAHLRRHMEEAGCAHLDVAPDEVWLRAGETFCFNSPR